jgi:hypothetical protein
MKVERRGASYDAIVVEGGESGTEKRHQGTVVVKVSGVTGALHCGSYSSAA